LLPRLLRCLPLALIALACAQPAPAPRGGHGLALPSPAPAPSAVGDPVVARVGATAIPLSLLQDQVSRHGGDRRVDAQAVLDALVELEAVVAAAVDEGYWTGDRLSQDYRVVLAQSLLVDRFERQMDASRVPMADLERVFKRQNVSLVYAHHDVFRVGDLQYVCCGDHYSVCDEEATQRCIEEQRALMTRIYEARVKGQAHNEHSLRYLAEEVLSPEHPEIKFMKYSFFFEQGVAYEQQAGYYKYNPNVVAAVVASEVGTAPSPVGSNNGLHIPFVLAHEPAEQRTLADPEVRIDIAERLLPGYRQRDLAILVDELMARHGVQIDDAQLKRFRLDAGAR
jgi:hypothetical protein